MRTAADLGTWVMSHAHGAEGIKRAVRAGVRSIDHGTYLDEEGAAMMVERGTWLVPTLTAGDTTEELANDPNLPPAVREKLQGLGRPGVRRVPARRRRRREGGDGHGLPGGSARHQPERAAAHGRARVHARRRRCMAATSSAAELMGLQDELGTIAPGKRADLVVVDGDPFDFDGPGGPDPSRCGRTATRVVPFALRRWARC